MTKEEHNFTIVMNCHEYEYLVGLLVMEREEERSQEEYKNLLELGDLGRGREDQRPTLHCKRW